MKPKKFNKKLALNKKTIVNLSSGKLSRVKGGATEKTVCCTVDYTYCDTCITLCTCPGLYTCDFSPQCAPATDPIE